jgi:hypothetical protein
MVRMTSERQFGPLRGISAPALYSNRYYARNFFRLVREFGWPSEATIPAQWAGPEM